MVLTMLLKKASEIAAYAEQKLQTIIKPIGEIFQKMKDRFVGLLTKSPIMQKYAKMLSCFINMKTVQAAKTLYAKIFGFVGVLTSLSGPTGWISLVVNLICGWEKLKAAITLMAAAWKQGDLGKKYYGYGQALGNIILATGA